MDDQNLQNNSNYQDNTSNMQGNTPNMQYQSQPVPPVYQEPQKTNVLAILGLVFGILSIVICCVWYIGAILGIAGLICSILSKKNGKSGIATAGMVCSIVGLVLCVVMFVFAILIGTSDALVDLMNNYY